MKKSVIVILVIARMETIFGARKEHLLWHPNTVQFAGGSDNALYKRNYPRG